MRRNARVLHPLQRLIPFAFGLLLVVFAFAITPASAQLLPPGQPVPQDIKYVSGTATTINTQVTTATRAAAGNTIFSTLRVPVSMSTIGKLAQGAVKRGLGLYGMALLAKDLINGAGYVIDELQGQVLVPSTQPPLQGGVWCMSAQFFGGSLSGQRCATTQLAAAYSPAPNGDGCTPVSLVAGSNNIAYDCGYQIPVIFNANPPPDAQNGNPGSPQQQVTAEQLAQLFAPHPDILNQLLVDPQTGAPVQTPELVAALNNLRRQLEAAGQLTGTGTDLVAPSNPGEESTPSQDAIPKFCTWAQTVCDFITWFKADPSLDDHPEIPHEQREITWQDYDSGHGGGSCPSPITVDLGWMGSFELTYTPICDFVVYMRALLIGLAWMAAAFIVVNATRRS